MAERQDDIEQVEVKDEFRTCPSCGYKDGFHVSFVPKETGKLKLVLICPSCSARYDIGMTL